ncbi:MAG: CsbD family protein, partial [Terrimicrobiaceae bacterium]
SSGIRHLENRSLLPLNCKPTGKLKDKVGEAMGDSGMRDGGTAEKVGGKARRKGEGQSRRSSVNSFLERFFECAPYDAVLILITTAETRGVNLENVLFGSMSPILAQAMMHSRTIVCQSRLF